MSTSYDLSPLYRHSTSHFVPSSPPTLLSSHQSKLILRSTSTLQIIRTWSLVSSTSPGTFSISISPSRTNPLVLAYHSKLALAWVLDPDQDEPVAKVEIGKVDGCTGITWDNQGKTVLIWSENHLRVSLFRLSDPTRVFHIQSPKSDSPEGYSFSSRYFALLERHQNRDCIAIYDPQSPNWSLLRNIVIPDPTSDLVGLKWSPNGGKYLVAWSSITNYYLHIFTPDGRLIKTYTPPPDSPSSISLGIRQIEWSPSGQFLAIGGYDGKIKILSKESNWQVVIVEFSTPVGGKIGNAKGKGKKGVNIWREPKTGWVEKTLGKGIIAFDQIEPSSRTPYLISNDYVAPDPTKPFPKMGWFKLRWSIDGKWLVGYNQSYPTHLYIFQVLVPSPPSSSEHDPSPSSSTTTPPRTLHLSPRLHTLIILNSPPKTFEFKPSASNSNSNETLFILSGSKSFVVWTSPLFPPSSSSTTTTTTTLNSEGNQEETDSTDNIGMVEGIGIPLASESISFNPNQLEFSPSPSQSEIYDEEEEAVLVGEKGGMFCLVYPVVGDQGKGNEGEGDRTWIEGGEDVC
ncbi:hypothetical protein JCM16303_000517 [Sporobolomyces ruberrimus]